MKYDDALTERFEQELLAWKDDFCRYFKLQREYERAYAEEIVRQVASKQGRAWLEIPDGLQELLVKQKAVLASLDADLARSEVYAERLIRKRRLEFLIALARRSSNG